MVGETDRPTGDNEMSTGKNLLCTLRQLQTHKASYRRRSCIGHRSRVQRPFTGMLAWTEKLPLRMQVEEEEGCIW